MPHRVALGLAALACTAAANPPAVNLNQLGFLPGEAKRAAINNPAKAPLAWEVRDAAGRVAASGRTEVVGDDAASGDHVHLATFTRLKAPGTYTLRVGGVESGRFRVAPDLYTPLARDALNFYYQQRAGVPIEARWAGGERWARAAGHPNEKAPCFSGKDEKGSDWPGCAYTLDVTGGWYDAGDHGKYVVNAGISLWTLQNLYESGLATTVFADGRGRLPEAGNGINDLLDEARWEMNWLLSMQVPNGQRIALPVNQKPSSQQMLTPVDAGGMAHHKVADRHWTGLPTRPADDKEPRLLYPPSTAATLNLAATAAQAARIWRTIDPAFSARCLEAARRAWAAAKRNPAIFAPETFTGSGNYGDEQLADEVTWAAAELFATTGERTYRDALAGGGGAVAEPSWGSVASLGTMTLATAPGVPAAIAKQARARIIAAADGFLKEEARSGYRIPYATQHYGWGSNSNVLNRAMMLGMAARFTGDARYRTGATDAMDYVLGRNPLGQSYVSGYGWQPLRNPHHRFWAHQLDPALPPPPPGIVSGGPNNTALADPVAAKLKNRCAPQRCWIDDIGAYALNEVAINWNAPLVWVSTYLASDPAA